MKNLSHSQFVDEQGLCVPISFELGTVLSGFVIPCKIILDKKVKTFTLLKLMYVQRNQFDLHITFCHSKEKLVSDQFLSMLIMHSFNITREK